MQSKMTGHEAGLKGASGVQPEMQVMANLGEERNPTSLSVSSSSSSSSNIEEVYSEDDGEVGPKPSSETGLALGSADARFRYSPLEGGSDSDSDPNPNNVDLFCEETLALLAHEIVCCDCDSDLESGVGEEESEELESESESDPIDGHGQNNLSHHTYQLMFSDEGEEESVSNEKDEENPNVESILLLGEDQESEEISDPKSRESNASVTSSQN